MLVKTSKWKPRSGSRAGGRRILYQRVGDLVNTWGPAAGITAISLWARW